MNSAEYQHLNVCISHAPSNVRDAVKESMVLKLILENR